MKTQFQHPSVWNFFFRCWRPSKTELEEDLRPPLMDSRLHPPTMDCQLYGNQWLIVNSVSKFNIHRFHVSSDISIILSLGGTIQYTTICLYIYTHHLTTQTHKAHTISYHIISSRVCFSDLSSNPFFLLFPGSTFES